MKQVGRTPSRITIFESPSAQPSSPDTKWVETARRRTRSKHTPMSINIEKPGPRVDQTVYAVYTQASVASQILGPDLTSLNSSVSLYT